MLDRSSARPQESETAWRGLARAQFARCMGSRHQKRLQDSKQYLRRDWEDNCVRAVYRWIRNDKSTPTVAVRVNNQRNSSLTANPTEIHHLFEKEWSKFFKRFIGANSEPDFAAFEARYRVHSDAMATPIDLPPFYKSRVVLAN